MKSAAKILRSNAITAGVTVIVLSFFDVANIFKGRISGKQLFKNLTNTTSTVAAGTAGWIGRAAISSAILPIGETIIGGLIGSISAGAAAGKAAEAIMGTFIEDDADEMVKIIQKVFERLAVDYLLSQKEAEKTIDKLRDELDGKVLQLMFACFDREGFAEELLILLIENEISKRRKIEIPTIEEFSYSLREILEEIADSMELATV